MRLKLCLEQSCLSETESQQPFVIMSTNPRFESAKLCMSCGTSLVSFTQDQITDLQGSFPLKRKRTLEAGSDDGCEAVVHKRQNNATETSNKETPKGTDTTNFPDKISGLLPVEKSQAMENCAEVGNKTSQKERNLQKWCLDCHWSDHSTQGCDGISSTKEPLVTGLQWAPFSRVWGRSLLVRPPNDIIMLMNQLHTHGLLIIRVEGFQVDRDKVLSSLLKKDQVMKNLQINNIVDGETSVDLYEKQINSANNSTKKFLLGVSNAILTVFKALVILQRRKASHETAVEFRRRLLAEVNAFPHRFSLQTKPLQNFLTQLEDLWTKYEKRMRDLEAHYITKYNADREPSMSVLRILRLPTSYSRMMRVKESQARPLWLPTFECPVVHDLEVYLDHETGLKLDCENVIDFLQELTREAAMSESIAGEPRQSSGGN